MTRLTSISLAGTIGKNYYGIGRDPGVITKTIGTASRDYSTITLWEADLDDTGTYTSGDDAVGECYNDSTFSESFTLNTGSTLGLSSVLLKPASGEGHDGTADTGVKVESYAYGQAKWSNVASIPSEIRQIDFKRQHNSEFPMITLSFLSSIINRCIVRNVSGSPQRSHINTGFGGGSVYNSILYGYTMRYGIEFQSLYGGFCNIINNTVFAATNANACVYGRNRNYLPEESIFKNNLLITQGSAVPYNTANLVPSSFANNKNNMTNYSSFPATHFDSSSIAGIDESIQFISTVSGSEDLHLSGSSDAIGAGQVLTAEYAVDIDGLYRGSVWDIGADQTPATVTKSIGTSGRDYSTMAAWEADLDTQGVYANGDSAVGECYNDSDFLAGVIINGGSTVGLAGVTLTAQSGERHDGTAGTGVRIVSQTNGDGLSGGFSGLTISFIEVDFNSLTNSTLYGYGSTYRGLLMHNGNHRGHVFYYDYSRMNAFNNTVYNMAGSKGLFVIRTTSSQLSYISNNTCYNIQGNSSAYYLRLSNTIGKNNIAVNTSQNGFTYAGSPTVSNNMSSDGSAASGADSIINADPNTQFISVVSGSEDLHLAASSDAIKAGVNLGTTPEGIQYDIDNRARGLVWDIGSDQAVSGHVRRTLLHVG